MNRVDLVGRLTRDPELRYATTGTPVTKFTVAINRKLSKEKRQELEALKKPTADFISCQAFGQIAETISKYFTKGSLIGVEGSIQTGNYKNNEGRTIYTTDVIVSSVDFIDSKNNNAGNNTENLQENSGFFPINNEDIPF